MIDKKRVSDIVAAQLDPVREFVVDLTISGSNKIMILIDGDDGITIDRCVAVSRAVQKALDDDGENFELEVSSPGLTEPFKVIRQYLKSIGRILRVELLAGGAVEGKLLAADDERFSLEVQELVKEEGKKRKVLVTRTVDLFYTDVKTAKKVISFR